MWVSFSPEGGEDDRDFSWTSGPRWRDDEQAFIACAQILELADGMEAFLHAFGDEHLPKKPADAPPLALEPGAE